MSFKFPGKGGTFHKNSKRKGKTIPLKIKLINKQAAGEFKV